MRPKMKSFEGARRRRRKILGYFEVLGEKNNNYSPLVNRRSATRGGIVIINSTDSFDCTRIESIVGESNTRHSVTVSRQNRVYFDQVLDTRGETMFFVITISFHRS